MFIYLLQKHITLKITLRYYFQSLSFLLYDFSIITIKLAFMITCFLPFALIHATPDANALKSLKWHKWGKFLWINGYV